MYEKNWNEKQNKQNENLLLEMCQEILNSLQ